MLREKRNVDSLREKKRKTERIRKGMREILSESEKKLIKQIRPNFETLSTNFEAQFLFKLNEYLQRNESFIHYSLIN